MGQMRLSSSIRSTSTSILPPLALRPNRRRDHPGVVKHQQIAGIELIEDVGEGAMRQRARRPVQESKRQLLALRHRIVGDQRFG